MAKWRVINKHPNGLTHREKFKEQLIEIKAGQYVLMDYEEAVQFRSQYFPMKKDPMGAPDPAGFKVIHLEKHEEDAVETKPVQMMTEFICHFDGAKFPTQALLDNYVAANYSDKIFKDEVLEEEIKKEKETKRSKAQTARAER